MYILGGENGHIEKLNATYVKIRYLLPIYVSIVTVLPQVIGTVVFTANNLKFFSSHDFSLTATWAGHWLLGRPKQLKREKS